MLYRIIASGSLAATGFGRRYSLENVERVFSHVLLRFHPRLGFIITPLLPCRTRDFQRAGIFSDGDRASNQCGIAAIGNARIVGRRQSGCIFARSRLASGSRLAAVRANAVHPTQVCR